MTVYAVVDRIYGHSRTVVIRKAGHKARNPKPVYRVMKVYRLLLLQRGGGRCEERRHAGRIAVNMRNTRWCSDGSEITCDNGEKVRVAFALDSYDREAVKHVRW